MKKREWNCPIAIVAYNRPEYLEKCLESIANSVDIQEYDFPIYVFCDGGPNSSQLENDEILYKYSFLEGVIRQKENLGIAKHTHFVKKCMFEQMDVPRFIYLEEDLVLSPYYYRFVNRAMDSIQKQTDQVLAVNSSIICYLAYEKKLIDQKLLVDQNASLCNLLYTRKSWEVTNPILEEYMDRFIGDSYPDRPHDRIIEWSKKMYNESKYEIRSKFIETAVSSQDSIFCMALRTNGFCHLTSYVNRVLYIGRYGENCNDDWWVESKLHRTKLDIFEGDRDLVDFTIHKA